MFPASSRYRSTVRWIKSLGVSLPLTLRLFGSRGRRNAVARVRRRGVEAGTAPEASEPSSPSSSSFSSLAVSETEFALGFSESVIGDAAGDAAALLFRAVRLDDLPAPGVAFPDIQRTAASLADWRRGQCEEGPRAKWLNRRAAQHQNCQRRSHGNSTSCGPSCHITLATTGIRVCLAWWARWKRLAFGWARRCEGNPEGQGPLASTTCPRPPCWHILAQLNLVASGGSEVSLQRLKSLWHTSNNGPRDCEHPFLTLQSG